MSYRIACWILLVFVLTPCQTYPQSSQSRQVDARKALISCVKGKTTKLSAVHGVTPVGVAYLVGLACSTERTKYEDSLTQAGGYDAQSLMQYIDMQIVDYVVGTTLSLQGRSAQH